MANQVGSPLSRFRLESHKHDGTFEASLPYRNVQHTCLMGVQGQTFTCEIPFRNFPQVTQANLYPGKHELWFFDNLYSDTDPIFAGPLWSATPTSSSGTLNCSAQDPLTYIKKRLLKIFKSYSAKTATFMINDLIAYTNGIRALNLVVSIAVANSQTSSPFYLGAERNVIADLLDSLSKMDDGTDYYMRTLAGVHNLILYGGQIKPTQLKFALEYGGNLDGYSVDYNAQAIANDIDEIATNGVIQNVVNAGKKTEYDALYEIAEDTDQIISSEVTHTATTRLKDTQSTKVTPSLVTHKLTPMVDFDFGSQFLTIIDDWYTQVNQVIRAIGWQFTVGQGDKTTTVIYTKDTEGVT